MSVGPPWWVERTAGCTSYFARALSAQRSPAVECVNNPGEQGQGAAMNWTNMETELVAEMVRGNPRIQALIREAFGVSNPKLNRPSLSYATVLIRNLLTETDGEQ